MVGEIISECRAGSNRNGGRDHSGMVGDIERNQHSRLRTRRGCGEKVLAEPQQTVRAAGNVIFERCPDDMGD
jgi:hypothetical protein